MYLFKRRMYIILHTERLMVDNFFPTLVDLRGEQLVFRSSRKMVNGNEARPSFLHCSYCFSAEQRSAEQHVRQ